MDLSKIKLKLVGSDDDRAVSPVIGVILMVAITVILAAVIAAFVLDLGDSVSEEAQAGVTINVDENDDEIQIQVTSLGNADYVNVTGDLRVEANEGDEIYYEIDSGGSPSAIAWDKDDPEGDTETPEEELSELGVGDVVTIGDAGDGSADILMDDDSESGTVTVVAVIEEDDTTTQVSSEEYDLDWSDLP